MNRSDAMKLASGKAKRQTKAALVAGMMLWMSGVSAALQTTSAPAPVVEALAKVSVRRILVSIPDRKLALLEDGKVVRLYHVAVGKRSTPSPVGEFQIVARVSNPTYFHKGVVIPPGKNNPVGTRWMGLSVKKYGIHGTNQPNSIGKAASSGCIRLGKRDLEELFTLVEVGDTVQISGERDGQIAAIFGDGDNNDAVVVASGSTGANATTTTMARMQTVWGNGGGQ